MGMHSAAIRNYVNDDCIELNYNSIRWTSELISSRGTVRIDARWKFVPGVMNSEQLLSLMVIGSGSLYFLQQEKVYFIWKFITFTNAEDMKWSNGTSKGQIKRRRIKTETKKKTGEKSRTRIRHFVASVNLRCRFIRNFMFFFLRWPNDEFFLLHIQNFTQSNVFAQFTEVSVWC